MSDNATRPRPPLLRGQDQKMVAGVCTGLGRHLDIDPVIFRILFAVLTFFGGLGILVYAAAWLLIPESGEEPSEAQRLLTGTNVYVAAAAAALMVLGLLAFTDIVAHGAGRSVPLALAGAAVIGVLIWHRENSTASPVRRPGAGEPDLADPTDPSAPQTWWQRPIPESERANPDVAENPDLGGDLGRDLDFRAALFHAPAHESTAPEMTPDAGLADIPEPADFVEPEASVVGGGDVQGIVGGLDARGSDDPDAPGPRFDFEGNRDGH